MSQRSFVFTENCLAIVLSEPKSHTISKKLEHTEMDMFIFMNVREGNFSEKTYFHTEKD